MKRLKRASKNGKIEGLKNGNRKIGALKAQLHIARGETPGHRSSPSISAPCKGSYIDIEEWKNGNRVGKMEISGNDKGVQPNVAPPC
jgi:hypothetical protein